MGTPLQVTLRRTAPDRAEQDGHRCDIEVRAIGEVDLCTAPNLRATLGRAVRLARPPTQVVANLDGVTFLASPCASQRTPLRIHTSSQAALRTLRLTGLDQLLDVALIAR